MATSWNKKERENKKQQIRKQKEEKRLERKEQAGKGKSLDDMIAYLDENGNLTSTPPDPSKRIEVKVEDIETGVPKQEERNPEDKTKKGVLIFFDKQKGFGFIEEERLQQRIFVHHSAFLQPLQEGMQVVFETEKGPRGLTAVNVSAAKP